MARALPNAPVTPASSSAGASHTYNLRKSSRGFPMTPVEVEILMTIYNRTDKPSRKDKEKLAKELHRPYATIDNWFSNRRRRTARASKATEKKRCSAPLGRTMDRLGNNSWTTLRDAVSTMRVCTTPKTTKDEQDSSRSWPQHYHRAPRPQEEAPLHILAHLCALTEQECQAVAFLCRRR